MCLLVPSQNALLPAGLRQKDHTSKNATGAFDRDRLLKHLEKEAIEYQDREDIIPFTGERKGEPLFFSSCPRYQLISAWLFTGFGFLPLKIVDPAT